jgi:hypothetical protein
MLTTTRDLLHWDGRAVQVVTRSICQPTQPTPAPAISRVPLLDFLVVSKDLVLVGGSRAGNPIDGAFQSFYATMDRQGVWRCDLAPHVYPQTFLRPVGASLWKSNYSGTLERLDGHPLPRPLKVAPRGSEAGMEPPIVYSIDSEVRAWTVQSGTIWRYTGVGWVPHPSPGFDDVGVWEDREGTPWIIARGAQGAPDRLARWSRGAWEHLSVPASFHPKAVLATGGGEMWFILATGLGAPGAYQWDGRTFRETQQPVPTVLSTWEDGAGTVWIAGSTKAPKESKDDPYEPLPGEGRVARLRPSARPK